MKKEAINKTDIYIKWLDKILGNYATPPDSRHSEREVNMAMHGLKLSAEKEDNLTAFEVDMLLRKLVEDGLLIYDGGSLYKITVKGFLYINEGGFVGERLRIAIKNAEGEDTIRRGERNSETLNRWTKVLALGTVALTITEAVKFAWDIYLHYLASLPLTL